MAPSTGREIHLVERPVGWPTDETFRLVEVPVAEPAEGEILVRNLFMSVDPAMRGRMNDRKSYVPPFQVGAALEGGAVGEVIASRSDRHKPGDVVLHGQGWREFAVLDGAHAKQVDTGLAPASAYLGVLGMPGLTAYAGIVEVAALKPDDTVFVSGAAGAVGSLAGQIARLKGAGRVVGSAGSPAKVEYVRSLGFDDAFDYHDGPIRRSLRRVAPDGIDLYFDNVGGEHLEAAISALHTFGRVALCGSISTYNDAEPQPGPRNLSLAVGKQLTLKGFIVFSYRHLNDEFRTHMAEWLRTGAIRYDETVVEGIENAPAALLGMLRGQNTGKMLVRLG